MNNSKPTQFSIDMELPNGDSRPESLPLPKKSVIQRMQSAGFVDKESQFHVKDLFLKSDLHGLPEWYEANGCLHKTLWSIIIVVCVTGLSFELWNVVDDFKNNPILTTYRLVAEPAKLDFPVIYLCPSSVIHQTERLISNVDKDWEKKNVQGMMKSHADDNGLQGILASKFTISESLSRFNPLQGQLVIPAPMPGPGQTIPPPPPPPLPWIPEDVQDYFMKVGYPVNTFFQECAWNAKPMPCELLATPVFDGDYGKCFAVRPPVEDSKQTTAGVGFSLVLNLDFDFAHSRDQPPLFDGFIMKISHDIDFASQNSMLLSPGLYTKTRLSAEKLNLIQRKGGKVPQSCVEEEVGRNNLTHLSPAKYTRDICYQDCVQQVVVRECNCYMPVDKQVLKNTSIPLCTATELNDCAYEAINKYNQTISDCALWCQVPCSSWSYQVDTSSAKFPSDVLRQPIPFQARAKRQATTEPPVFETTEEDISTPSQTTELPIFITGEPILFTEFLLPPTPPEPIIPIPFTPPPPPFTIPAPLTPPPEAFFTQQRWGRGDMLILDIAYSSLQYTDVTQDQSMTFSTFVSNIGGQVGLWVGASIVTMIKFFVLLTPLCCGRRKAKEESRNGDL